jgi:hypothetical protein
MEAGALRRACLAVLDAFNGHVREIARDRASKGKTTTPPSSPHKNTPRR